MFVPTVVFMLFANNHLQHFHINQFNQLSNFVVVKWPFRRPSSLSQNQLVTNVSIFELCIWVLYIVTWKKWNPPFFTQLLHFCLNVCNTINASKSVHWYPRQQIVARHFNKQNHHNSSHNLPCSFRSKWSYTVLLFVPSILLRLSQIWM